MGGIGSTISLNNVPRKDSKRQPDPKKRKKLYWIQRVTTNYPALIGNIGQKIIYIDNIRKDTRRIISLHTMVLVIL